MSQLAGPWPRPQQACGASPKLGDPQKLVWVVVLAQKISGHSRTEASGCLSWHEAVLVVLLRAALPDF